MAVLSLKAEGHASMTAAVTAMDAAIDGASQAIDAALQSGIVKIGSGNYGYWVLYEGA